MTTAQPIGYAWQRDGKFYLSVVRPGQRFRPANSYDTDTELVQAAERRGLELKWDQP